MDHCRSCRAPIDWRVNLRTGRPAPIDADPVPDGDVLVMADGRHSVIGRADPTPPADMLRFKNHWSTCPDAKAWKKRQGRKAS